MTPDHTLRGALAKPSRLQALIPVLIGAGVGAGGVILFIALTHGIGVKPKALINALDGRDFVLFAVWLTLRGQVFQ
jgi:hypothetical protein